MLVKKILKKIYLSIMGWGLFNWVPDEIFLKIFYKAATGKKLNIDNPQTFNEKIQWMKLYDHNPIYVQLADKYEVRKYVESKIGGSYLIPLIAHWNTCREINFVELPNQFVLKCTHDSGGLVICRDNDTFDKEEAIKKLNKCLKRNFYYVSREWAYKDIKPQIICEQYLSEDSGEDIKDYKFFCFNGEPKMVQVDFDRYTNHGRNLYTANWEFVDLSIKCPNNSEKIITKPVNYDDMLQVARTLSEGFPFVRIDLYSINGKTYFGEFTFYHGSGIEKFSPSYYELDFGNWIQLNRNAL